MAPASVQPLLLRLTALAVALLLLLAPPAHGFLVLDPKDVPEGCAAEPAAISLDGLKVLEVRSTAGAESVSTVAERGSRTLLELARNQAIKPEAIGVKHLEGESFIMLQQPGEPERRLGVLNQRTARCYGMEPRELADLTRNQVRTAIVRYRQVHSQESWLRGSALAALVLGVYVLWLRMQFRINGRVRDLIFRRETFLLQKLSRLGLSGLLKPEQVRRLLQGLRSSLHWVLLLLISYLLVPLLLGFFPPTQAIANGLRQQLRDLAIGLFEGLVDAIPNLLSIAVIIGIGVLVARFSNGVFEAIRLGRLRIPGFYREWARPTSRLVVILIAVATAVIAFPYIPGSSSKAFQGAGIFVGVFAALGSSAVAANIISGLLLIYTRAFREGDLVELNGLMGTVQDRTLLVTRLQTPHNQLVSIPNVTVISNAIANYSFSRREIRQPVALSTTITIGYDVPWRQVEELMLAATRSVEGVTDELEPFVLQTALNDFHISYELTAYLRDANTYRQSLSQLHGALQDRFAEAGVE
ncbi:mechanosensitive ion channel family protein, partial [Aphanothece microscopica]